MNYTAQTLKNMLLEDLPKTLLHLNAKWSIDRQTKVWRSIDGFVEGHGENKGMWFDEEENYLGDVLDLWMHTHGYSLRHSAVIIKIFLGIITPDDFLDGVGNKQNNIAYLQGWGTENKTARKLIISINPMNVEGYACVQYPSLPGDWVSVNLDDMSVFDVIYFESVENEKDTREIAERIGFDRARLVSFKYADVHTSIECASVFLKSPIKRAADMLDDSLEYLYPPENKNGYLLPFPKTHSLTTLPVPSVNVWTGINGHGKSIMISQIVSYLIVQGAKIGVFNLEMSSKIFMGKMIRQISAEKLPTKKTMKAIHDSFGNNLFVVSSDSDTPDKVINHIVQMRRKNQVDVFFVDSLLLCGIDEDDYVGQTRFVAKLVNLCKEWNIQIHMIAHPKKSRDDTEDDAPGKMSIKGTSSISNLADNIFVVHRNKKKEHEMRKNPYHRKNDILHEPDAYLACVKQRDLGIEWDLQLWFDQATGQFLEFARDKPNKLLNWKMEI